MLFDPVKKLEKEVKLFKNEVFLFHDIVFQQLQFMTDG